MTFNLEPFRYLYPFEGRYFDRDGLRMHYLDEGEGAPLVCLHGNPSWSFYYRNLVKALGDSFRLIVPDHIGCGLSDKPGDDRYPYLLKNRIDDVEALLDHLEIDRNATLILHDWGGAIGMGCAARRPERIARLILMNTAAFMPEGGWRLPWQLKFVRDNPLGAFLVRGCNAFALGATYLAAARGMTGKVRRAYTAPYDSWRNRIATLRFVQDIPTRPTDPSYAVIREIEEALPQFADRPTLLCWGEKDFVFDRTFLERWRQIFPEAEVASFSDAGHYVLEDASPHVIAHVRRFLRRHPLTDDPA